MEGQSQIPGACLARTSLIDEVRILVDVFLGSGGMMLSVGGFCAVVD